MKPIAWVYRPVGSDWKWKVRRDPVDSGHGFEVAPLYTLAQVAEMLEAESKTAWAGRARCYSNAADWLRAKGEGFIPLLMG